MLEEYHFYFLTLLEGYMKLIWGREQLDHGIYENKPPKMVTEGHRFHVSRSFYCFGDGGLYHDVPMDLSMCIANNVLFTQRFKLCDIILSSLPNKICYSYLYTYSFHTGFMKHFDVDLLLIGPK